MKKLICMILALVMALSLAACGGKETASVSTDGSTSMQKVINALGEAFMEETGANFTYNATGSGTGIKAVKDGTCDIGLSSRYLKDSEKAEGLKETILAIDGIAIIVHTDNSVADLTVEQIAAIKDGSYAVQRPFVLVTKDGVALSETAQALCSLQWSMVLPLMECFIFAIS